jgi:FkbM family methyltransferase
MVDGSTIPPTRRAINAVRGGLNRVGIDVVRHPPRRPVFVHLSRLLPLLRPNCVLDVGAYEGEYARELRDVGYSARIVSFEPVVATFERLERAAANDPSWIVRRLALGAEESTGEINVTAVSHSSSFLEPSTLGFEVAPGVFDLDHRERVDVTTVDSVFEECVAGLDDRRVFLKIDTQGWDLEVLRGAESSLDRIQGIQVELSFIPLYEGSTSYLDALATLRDLGFTPSGFFPVLSNSRLELVEADCILVRL